MQNFKNFDYFNLNFSVSILLFASDLHSNLQFTSQFFYLTYKISGTNKL
jgi:hypothetical protein